MKTKKLRRIENAGAGGPAHGDGGGGTQDNADLITLASQIDLQRRAIEATTRYQVAQQTLAAAQANLSKTATGTGNLSDAYLRLATCQVEAGIAEHAKLGIEIEFATRQVEQMEEMLRQAKAERGVA